MARIGELIGRFRVEEIIGSGGMSKVYKVKDMRLGTIAAMKEIKISDKRILSTAFTEAEILKRIKHPRIPRIIDIIRTDETYCVVMDYIEGENLNEYKKRKGVISEKETIEIGCNVLNTLGFLHSHNIIYRDLKPTNIMIDSEGEIKIIDFGISDISKTRFKGTNSATREFAPPEILLGKSGDIRSDIYSFGMTLNCLCPKHSYAMEWFINKCTEFEPEKRFKNTEEAISELNKISDYNNERIKLLTKKRGNFVFFLIMFFLSVSGLFFIHTYKNNYEKEVYEKLVKEAHEGESESKRKESLELLIEEEGNYEWFSQYLEEIKSDGVFDKDEVDSLEKILSDYDKKTEQGNATENTTENANVNAKEGRLSKEDYSAALYETGRLYMFFYETENEKEKLPLAKNMFDKSFEEGFEEAKVYSDICNFRLRINSLILEGKDTGVYKEYYENICHIIAESKNEEAIKYDFYELGVDSVYAYSADFYREGIGFDKMKKLLSEIEEDISDDENLGSRASKTREKLMIRIKEAREEIDVIESLDGR